MKKQQGFSLIELMIVVAVIGVLTSIAIPQYQNYVKKSEAGAALATLNALKVNAEDYIATNGKFPTNAAAIDDPKFSLATNDTVTVTPNTPADTGGILAVSFDTDTGLTGNQLQIVRSTDGVWQCKISTAVKESIRPKNCIAL